MDTSQSLSEEEHARLRRELAGAVARVCPSWLADQADDLVQVALMRVLDARRRSEEKTELSPFYLRKAAYSALIDEIRRLRRRREVPLEANEEGPGPVSRMASGRPDPEAQAAGHQVGSAIRSCLGRLVRPRRLAVALHLQGHSVPEIGKLLGWASKRADNLVYRGLADLRECLRSRGIEP